MSRTHNKRFNWHSHHYARYKTNSKQMEDWILPKLYNKKARSNDRHWELVLVLPE